jgi:hypothetical protein
MRKCVYFLFLGFVLWQSDACAWGFWAHQRINYMACFTLPPELFSLYKKNIRFVFEHAVDPDQRRYSDPEEAPRHFMDLDRYGGVDSVPHRWEDAVCKFSEDTLKEHGIVPWAIQRTYYRLVRAFAEHNTEHILYFSSVLGHYVADAHVPLHCTRNYNGQLTGQKGIHGLWESRLPELFGPDYDWLPEPCCNYIRPLETAWTVLRESSAAVDSVLGFERRLDEQTRSDRKYAFEERGTQVLRVYSRSYSGEYHTALEGQVERRMRMSVVRVGSFWYSAWVDAGQPSFTPDSLISLRSPEEIIDSLTTGKISPHRSCD